MAATSRARRRRCARCATKFRNIFSMKDDRESALPAIWSSSWSRSADRVRETFAFMLLGYYPGRIRARPDPAAMLAAPLESPLPSKLLVQVVARAQASTDKGAGV